MSHGSTRTSGKKRRRRSGHPGRHAPPLHEFRGSFFEGPTEAPAGRLGARARRVARIWGAPLWAHLAALTVLVLLLGQAMYLTRANWVNDEGLYALQTVALHEGSWEYRYAGAEFDPEGRWFPPLTSSPVDGKMYPYIKHPVYPLLLYASTSVLGTGGLGFFAIPMLGLVVAAAAAWLLAAEFEPRAARPAFWIVAASPLAVNAYVLWAHTLSAGLAGLALVALVRVVKRGPTALNVAGLAATCAAGIPIRTEGLLFAVATPLTAVGVLVAKRRYRQALAVGAACYAAAAAVVTAEAGLWARIVGADLARGLSSVLNGSPGRRAAELAALVALAVAAVALAPRLKARPRLALGLGVAAVGLGLTLMAGPLAHAGQGVLGIEGESPVRALGGFLEARRHAFWRTFFDPSGQSRRGSQTLLAALGVLGVVGLALRLRGRELSLLGMGVAAAGLLVGVWLYTVRFAEDSIEYVSGFFAAWPLALLGLLLLPWRATGGPERVGAAAVALFAGAVFFTQYESGALVEWGGRFLSPVVVPLAALVAVGLYRSISARSWRQRWVATAFLVAVAAFPVSQGIGVVRARANAVPLFEDIGAASTDVVVVNYPTLWGLYQDAWPLYEGTDVFFVRDESGRELLDELYERGVDDVTLIQSWRQGALTPDTFPDTYPSVAEVTPPHLGAVGVRMFVVSRSVERVTMGPPA